ncbi:MAG TPA: LemA family protein [Candidatus Omnitrophica bacterium]|nr:LemA family protein [Candidatus Omnitrophota bacterium]
MREDREKIKKMMLEGKINSDEAKLLLKALDESERKKERIFKEVLNHKRKREKTLLKILGVWFLFFFLATSFPFYLGKLQSSKYSLTLEALEYFQKTNHFLKEGDYLKAAKFCRKGIEKSPTSLGYSLLGVIYELVYKETKNNIFKEKARVNFDKAEKLRINIKGGEKMRAILFLFILLIIILSFIGLGALLFYNLLVKREEKANKSFADIQAQYQKKLDLVPVLLEAVKNYAAHEKETQLQVAQARSKVQEVMEGFLAFGKEKLKKFLESQKELNTGLARLFALAEKYPDLKASANFLTIQKQLEDIENTIARKREIYNNQVRVYNSSLRYFPMNLIVKVFKFEPKEYFEMEKV